MTLKAEPFRLLKVMMRFKATIILRDFLFFEQKGEIVA